MYGLKQEIDLSFLRDKELIQVCVGVYQLQFAFTESVNVSVEGRCEIQCDGGRALWEPKSLTGASAALRLLGAVVKEVHGSPDGTLTLDLIPDGRLIVFDNSREYESYTITRPGETIVV
jgi:hypothetical protein